MSSDTETQLFKFRDDAASDANNSEETLSKQIILVTSGSIALIGALVSKSNISITLSIKILLLVAVFCLFISLISGIVHFVVNYRFWTKVANDINDLLSTIRQIANEAERNNIAANSIANRISKSSQVPLLVQLTSFLLGALSLVVIIIIFVFSG